MGSGTSGQVSHVAGQFRLADENFLHRRDFFFGDPGAALPTSETRISGSSSQAAGQLSHVTGQLSLTVPNAQRLELFLGDPSHSPCRCRCCA